MLRLLALSLLIAIPARAEIIPLDPAIAFDDLAAHYRRHPSAELVEVRATANAQSRAEPILLQIVPPATLQLTFGDLTAWSDSTILRITHRLDEQAYIERTVEHHDLLAALSAALPPLPLPQLALAFSDDPEESLTPYLRAVRWTKASVDDSTRPAIVTIEGASDRAEATLKADAATGRILRLLTSLDAGMTTVELTTKPLPASEAPTIGIDISRRDRVNDPADFRSRGGKLLIGDPLPAFGLNLWRNDQNLIEEPRGPAAIIFIRRWHPGTSPRPAYEAAKQLNAERPDFQPFIALIFESGEPNESAIADGVEQEAAPLEVHRGNDPDRSIVRFSNDADQLLVIIDSSNIIRAIEPLTPQEPGAATDAKEVERLAAVMRGAIPK